MITKENTSTDTWQAPVYKQTRAVTIDTSVAKANHCLVTTENKEAVAGMEVLRSHLLNHTRTNGWRTVMITSAQPGEGKTLTAINLALTMAREYQQTVVLVDADLRKPSVAQYLGIGPQPGLADYFLGDTPLQDIMLWPGVEKLTMIAGDKAVPNAAEIMGSPKMKELVLELKDRYQDRYALFDLPPLLALADPISFIDHVDCVLLVVEAGQTSSRDIKKAQSLIPDDKLLGLVLNRDTAPRQPY
ncbi:MAG: tyrosine protein kinase [Deltaproteobacteria bacterium]|nr:MAG: tyrosine protein kinase [Deltaproteobacteria bacterium]